MVNLHNEYLTHERRRENMDSCFVNIHANTHTHTCARAPLHTNQMWCARHVIHLYRRTKTTCYIYPLFGGWRGEVCDIALECNATQNCVVCSCMVHLLISSKINAHKNANNRLLWVFMKMKYLLLFFYILIRMVYNNNIEQFSCITFSSILIVCAYIHIILVFASFFFLFLLLSCSCSCSQFPFPYTSVFLCTFISCVGFPARAHSFSLSFDIFKISIATNSR